MGRVVGLGRHAEVVERAHLRKAVLKELAATAERCPEEPAIAVKEFFSDKRRDAWIDLK